MKIIELLNKVANGELEDKTIFIYNDTKYIYRVGWDGIWGFENNNINFIFELNADQLNDEIEIIEEPKEVELPKELTRRTIHNDFLDYTNFMLENRIAINGILSYLKSKEGEKDK